MEERSATDHEFNLWAMIIQSRDIIFHARDKELSEYGITAVEARALAILNRLGDNATPVMISREMIRGHNTVMALMNRMSQKGLIAKHRDPNKKNSWLISLTDKGKEAFAYSMKREMIKEIFSEIPGDDLLKMTDYLEHAMEAAARYLNDRGWDNQRRIYP